VLKLGREEARDVEAKVDGIRGNADREKKKGMFGGHNRRKVKA